jgi:hypothetical protein
LLVIVGLFDQASHVNSVVDSFEAACLFQKDPYGILVSRPIFIAEQLCKLMDDGLEILPAGGVLGGLFLFAGRLGRDGEGMDT